MMFAGTTADATTTNGAMMDGMAFVRRVVAGLVGTVVLLVLVAGTASAHAVLESTDPVADSTLTVAPSVITLTFGESVSISSGSIRLFDASGREVSLPTPTHPGGKGPEVQAKPPKLAQGTYVVSWRVISADSHPVNGAFTFNVGTASGNASGLISKYLNATGSKTVGVLFGIDRFLGYATTALVIGGFLFAAWCWSGGPSSERARRWLVRSAMGGAVVSAVGIALQGAYGGGFGVGQIFKPSLWWDTLGQRFGRAELIRIVAFVGAVAVARALAKASKANWWAGAATVSLALAGSIAFAGHGATGRWVVLAFALDVIHVLAFSVWIGGLVGLIAWALRDPDVESVMAASRRFSSTAMIAVAAVVISGTVQGIRQVGTFSALTSTTYGWLLVAKVAVVIVIVGVAWVSRTLVQAFVAPAPAELESADSERVVVLAGAGGPASEVDGPDVESTEGGSTDGGSTDRDPADVDDLADYEFDPGEIDERNDTIRHYLRRSIGVEVLGIVAVLVLSTLLSAAIPAGESVSLPFNQTIVSSDGFAQVEVLPARAGLDAIHVTVTNTDGTIPQLAAMTVELRLPAQNVGPLTVSMEQLAPNHYVNDSATIPFAGTWTVTVKARVGDFDEKTFIAKVPVH
jgi:copper transport protein